MSESIIKTMREAIEAAIEGATAEVEAGTSAGHYSVVVRSEVFQGKPMVQAHRLVYSAVAHLMEGQGAPVHAIDRLQTLVP